MFALFTVAALGTLVSSTLLAAIVACAYSDVLDQIEDLAYTT